MLTLIGLGLNDEKDITLKGLETAKAADKVYIELYTSRWHGNLENLRSMVGKEVTELVRKDLEEDSEKIINEAKAKNVVIFTQGDPMVATTHTILIEQAKKEGIETKVVHNASILSAIAETGLHAYKFGPSVTIPFPEKTKGILPKSVYELIHANELRNLHTLCLMDVIAEQSKYMTIKEAINILLALEEEMGEEAFTEYTEVIIFARAGSESQSIFFGKVGELIEKDFGEPPMAMIIPGELHFTEREYLKVATKA